MDVWNPYLVHPIKAHCLQDKYHVIIPNRRKARRHLGLGYQQMHVILAITFNSLIPSLKASTVHFYFKTRDDVDVIFVCRTSINLKHDGFARELK